MAASTDKTNKPLIPRGVDDRPVDKYNRAELYSGKALDFDGVNDYVSVADSANLSFGDGTTDSPFSITGYFNLDVLGTNQTIAAKDNISNREYSLFVTTNNQLRFFIKNNGGAPQQSIDSDLVLEAGKWYFVSATYDGRGGNTAYQGLNIYVNGQLTGVDSFFDNSYTAMANTSAPFTAGVYGSAWMNGQISNVKVFAGELTAAQVVDLYNNPEKVVPTGVDNTALKLWLPMQEGAGTTAYDGSGNGNHGTISGATWTHGIGAPVAQTAVIDWNKGTNIVQNTDVSASYWSAGSQVTRTGDQESVSGLYNSATLIEDTTTNASHWAGAAVSTSASTTYVQAAFVKKKDSGIYASLRTNGAGSNSFIVFDFDSATIVGVGSDIIDSGVIAFSNGWYRIWMKYTLAPSGIIIGVSNSTSAPIPAYAGTGIGFYADFPTLEAADEIGPALTTNGTAQTSPVLLPQGLTSGRDITGVNLFENVRKQGALNLDGNSWAEVHDNASVDVVTGITLECWVYFEGISQSGLLAKWGSTTGVDRCYMLMTGADGKVRFYTNTDAGIDTTALSIGWNHIVGTYDKTTPIRKLYINAVEKDSDAYSTDLVVSDKPVEIGRYNYSTQYQHPGQIAQPRVYNRALTASEVLNNYNTTKDLYI